MDTVITVEGLHKRYGDVVAVDDVGFEVRRGEIFGLLGPNGAGKTTTVEILQGLRHRDGGAVAVLGMDPGQQAGRLRRRVGSQLQSSALPPRLRVGEAVRLFGKSHGEVDVAAVLADWGLAAVEKRPFAALSGGQRQRLFLALALLGRPEIVFLDELTTGLDPQARRATWDLVHQVRDRGATVVLVTHLMEEAEELCDRVAIIDGGRVVAVDSPAALTARQGGAVVMTFSSKGADAGFLSGLAGVNAVTHDNGTTVVTGSPRSVVPVATALAAAGIEPDDLRTRYPSLEDVFLTLTGRSLRD